MITRKLHLKKKKKRQHLFSQKEANNKMSNLAKNYWKDEILDANFLTGPKIASTWTKLLAFSARWLRTAKESKDQL